MNLSGLLNVWFISFVCFGMVILIVLLLLYWCVGLYIMLVFIFSFFGVIMVWIEFFSLLVLMRGLFLCWMGFYCELFGVLEFWKFSLKLFISFMFMLWRKGVRMLFLNLVRIFWMWVNWVLLIWIEDFDMLEVFYGVLGKNFIFVIVSNDCVSFFVGVFFCCFNC